MIKEQYQICHHNLEQNKDLGSSPVLGSLGSIVCSPAHFYGMCSSLFFSRVNSACHQDSLHLTTVSTNAVKSEQA